MTRLTELINDCQQAATDNPNSFVFAILDHIGNMNRDMQAHKLFTVEADFLEGVMKEYSIMKLRSMKRAREQAAAAKEGF